EDAQIFRRYAGQCRVFRIRVDHAADCEQAREHLRSGDYDLIFLDFHLEAGPAAGCGPAPPAR
ncbi:MAG: hypothetical protein R6V05_08830, partial [Candidatus Brocadiia bacterium]